MKALNKTIFTMLNITSWPLCWEGIKVSHLGHHLFIQQTVPECVLHIPCWVDQDRQSGAMSRACVWG